MYMVMVEVFNNIEKDERHSGIFFNHYIFFFCSRDDTSLCFPLNVAAEIDRCFAHSTHRVYTQPFFQFVSKLMTYLNNEHQEFNRLKQLMTMHLTSALAVSIEATFGFA